MSVREKVLGAESRWLMGRVMAGDFLEGVGKYLYLVAPERDARTNSPSRRSVNGRIPSTRSTRHAGRRNRSTAPAGTLTSNDPGRTCSR